MKTKLLTISVLCILVLSNLQADNQYISLDASQKPNELIISAPIRSSFKLAFENKGEKGYLKEYLPQGENFKKWSKMITLMKDITSLDRISCWKRQMIIGYITNDIKYDLSEEKENGCETLFIEAHLPAIERADGVNSKALPNITEFCTAKYILSPVTQKLSGILYSIHYENSLPETEKEVYRNEAREFVKSCKVTRKAP